MKYINKLHSKLILPNAFNEPAAFAALLCHKQFINEEGLQTLMHSCTSQNTNNNSNKIKIQYCLSIVVKVIKYVTMLLSKVKQPNDTNVNNSHTLFYARNQSVS